MAVVRLSPNSAHAPQLGSFVVLHTHHGVVLYKRHLKSSRRVKLSQMLVVAAASAIREEGMSTLPWWIKNDSLQFLCLLAASSSFCTYALPTVGFMNSEIQWDNWYSWQDMQQVEEPEAPQKKSAGKWWMVHLLALKRCYRRWVPICWTRWHGRLLTLGGDFSWLPWRWIWIVPWCWSPVTSKAPWAGETRAAV